MKKVIIIGAGGFGREVYNTLQRMNRSCSEGTERYDCVGFLDDNPDALNGFDCYPRILGSVSGATLDPQTNYILGVGTPKVRREIALLFKDYWNLFPAIGTLKSNLNESPRPIGITLGCGSYINGRLGVGSTVGRFVLINNTQSLGHDMEIGDFCEIAPGNVISGGVKLGEGVFIGSGAIVGPRVQIGAWSKISAGAVVLEDVPPCSFVASPRCKIFKDFFLSYDERK